MTCRNTRFTWSGAALPVVSAMPISIRGSRRTPSRSSRGGARLGTTPSYGQWKAQETVKRMATSGGVSRTMAAGRRSFPPCAVTLALLWLSVTLMNRPMAWAPAAIAAFEALAVGHQHHRLQARQGLGEGQHLCPVGHLRHRPRRDEGLYLHPPDPRRMQGADEGDLRLRRHHRPRDRLDPIARGNLADGHPLHGSFLPEEVAEHQLIVRPGGLALSSGSSRAGGCRRSGRGGQGAEGGRSADRRSPSPIRGRGNADHWRNPGDVAQARPGPPPARATPPPVSPAGCASIPRWRGPALAVFAAAGVGGHARIGGQIGAADQRHQTLKDGVGIAGDAQPFTIGAEIAAGGGGGGDRRPRRLADAPVSPYSGSIPPSGLNTEGRDRHRSSALATRGPRIAPPAGGDDGQRRSTCRRDRQRWRCRSAASGRSVRPGWAVEVAQAAHRPRRWRRRRACRDTAPPVRSRRRERSRGFCSSLAAHPAQGRCVRDSRGDSFPPAHRRGRPVSAPSRGQRGS